MLQFWTRLIVTSADMFMLLQIVAGELQKQVQSPLCRIWETLRLS